MQRKLETFNLTREAAMKTKLEFPWLDTYGTHPSATIRSKTIAGHAVIGYLMSIGDVVVALSIMIAICSLSLLSLYSALGAF